MGALCTQTPQPLTIAHPNKVKLLQRENQSALIGMITLGGAPAPFVASNTAATDVFTTPALWTNVIRPPNVLTKRSRPSTSSNQPDQSSREHPNNS